MTPESEQWLLDGDCSKCRREKYCGVYCTKGKQRSIIPKALCEHIVEICEKNFELQV